jgi:hypothetical protein
LSIMIGLGVNFTDRPLHNGDILILASAQRFKFRQCSDKSTNGPPKH